MEVPAVYGPDRGRHRERSMSNKQTDRRETHVERKKRAREEEREWQAMKCLYARTSGTKSDEGKNKHSERLQNEAQTHDSAQENEVESVNLLKEGAPIAIMGLKEPIDDEWKREAEEICFALPLVINWLL